ncbi:MAG: SDR family oxidoreductase [Gemmatimonadota bacterium]|nr:SDR family oxidoreductase [Gemmatimonadota bacterium]
MREVQTLEAMGAEVAVFAADLTDSDATNALAESVLERFGTIDGVIHAAGVLDDGPLLAREDEQIRAVLDPEGAGCCRLLEEALEAAGIDPDFFAVFSSSSAVIGAAGQVDYTAANAALDAFAEGRSRDGRGRTISVAWGPWRDVGMAAELSGTERYSEDVLAGEAESASVEHPVFDMRVDEDEAVAFRAHFQVGRHWMLDEHKVRGDGWVLPGAGYVELVRSAYHEAPRHGSRRRSRISCSSSRSA